MKKEKFTPGPWGQLKNSDATDILIGGEKEYVCRANSHISKNEANAALIAAAPELYAGLVASNDRISTGLTALQKLAEQFPAQKMFLDGLIGDFMHQMRLNNKALAKARGENVD